MPRGLQASSLRTAALTGRKRPWLKSCCAGIGLCALGACAIPPEGTTEEDVARYITAAATIDCDMIGESDYLPVELQAGLTRSQTQAITAFLLSTERAVRLQPGGVRITAGECAPTT